MWPSNPGNLNCRSFGHLILNQRVTGIWALFSPPQWTKYNYCNVMKNTAFWDDTLCIMLESYQCYVVTYCLKLQGRRHISPLPNHVDTEGESSIPKQDIQSPLWEPQICGIFKYQTNFSKMYLLHIITNNRTSWQTLYRNHFYSLHSPRCFSLNSPLQGDLITQVNSTSTIKYISSIMQCKYVKGCC
jgi:hypothetical protein